eukprot:1162087-Pelagomonas_calceolata.AAC.17
MVAVAVFSCEQLFSGPPFGAAARHKVYADAARHNRCLHQPPLPPVLLLLPLFTPEVHAGAEAQWSFKSPSFASVCLLSPSFPPFASFTLKVHAGVARLSRRSNSPLEHLHDSQHQCRFVQVHQVQLMPHLNRTSRVSLSLSLSVCA